ncbi:TPA: lysis system o-spanin lipoprotein Rz1 [Salmonella enterica subsp. diarizonae serovar 61:r:z53]
MRKLRMMLCSAALLPVVGCASKDVVQCQPAPHPPAPAAWAMLPPSNSLLLLDETFSVSELELSTTRKR